MKQTDRSLSRNRPKGAGQLGATGTGRAAIGFRLLEPLEQRCLLSTDFGVVQHKLTDFAQRPADNAGAAVATADGLVLIGAPFDDDRGTDAGAAYLRDAASGALIAKLYAPDPLAGDHFGTAVGISGDRLIIGSPLDDDRAVNSGSAYIFDTAGNFRWKLTDAGAATGDGFGQAVAISGDIAIVGVPGDDDNGTNAGSVFRFTVSTGVGLGKFYPPDPLLQDQFGAAVAISGDAIIVGSPFDDDRALNSGSAYLFNASGTFRWKLTDAGAVTGDAFGSAVAIDGNIAAVGVWGDDDGGLTDSGSVWLFNVTTGIDIAKMHAHDPAAGDNFGFSVAVHAGAVLVGSPRDDDNGLNSGSAYLFDGDTTFELGKYIAADGAAADTYGWSVALADDGPVMGSPGDDGGAGSAYLLKKEVWIDLVDSADGSLGAVQTLPEGATARFRVGRSSLLLAPLRVYFNVSGEADPSDFQGGALFSGYVDIPQGLSSVVVEIPINADGRADTENQFRNERLSIALDTDPYTPGQQGNPTGDLVRDQVGRWVPRPGGAGAESGYIVPSDRWRATAEILDLDATFVKIESSDATGGELSGDSVDFTLTRGGNIALPLTIQIDISGTALLGSDYFLELFGGGTISSNGPTLSLTFPAGLAQVTLTALPINDNIAEGIEWVHVALVEGAGYTLTTDPARRFARVGFIDDDMPSVMLKPVVSEIVESSGGALHFQIARGGIAYTQAPLTANVSLEGAGSTAIAEDYQVRLGSPTGSIINPDTGGFYQVSLAGGVETADVYLTPIDDTAPEQDERIVARLISGSTYLSHPTLDRVEMVIREDVTDQPLVTVEVPDPYASESNIGGAISTSGTGEFVVRRSTQGLSNAMTVYIALGGTATWGVDLIADVSDARTPIALNFNAGESEVHIIVRPRQDGLSEPTEVATLRVLRAGPYRINVGVDDLGSVSITDQQANAGTRALWDWSMPDRYGIDRNADGRIDIPNTFDYANPQGGFDVRFDGAASTSSTNGLAFTWSIVNAMTGVEVYTSTLGVFVCSLPEQAFRVNLKVTDDNGQWSEMADLIEVNDILIVSAGDSAASGEGNPEISAHNDIASFLNPGFSQLTLGQWADDGVSGVVDPNLGGYEEYDHAAAHRSTLAASSLTALEIERSDSKSSVTFVFVAQSGAEVTDGFADPMAKGQDGKWPDGYRESQVDKIKRIIGNRQIDSMLMSFGINDVGFSDLITKYLRRYRYRHWLTAGLTGGESETLDDIEQFINTGLQRLPSRFRTLDLTLESVLRENLPPAANIFLQNYPDSTGGSNGQPAPALRDWSDNLGAAFIEQFVGLGALLRGRVPTDNPIWQISAEEAAHARDHALLPLNAAVAAAARTYGWSLLSMPPTFATHGWGASDSWFRTMTESRINQGGDILKSPGALHPNDVGHQQISLAQLATFLGDSRPAPSVVGATDGVLSIPEGGTSSLAAVDTRERRSGALSYQWDLDYDGVRFSPDATGPTAVFDASSLAYPATGRIALRATDRLGRSTFKVIDVGITNAPGSRLAFEVSTVDAGAPFLLGLQRVRQSSDPARLWRVDWGDGTVESVPADWAGRSRIYSAPGVYQYRVWLTDAAGESEVQGGQVTVVANDPFPTVSITALDAQTVEGGASARLRFARTGSTNLPLSISINFASGPGLAENGTDFVDASGQSVPLSVFFPAGQSTTTVDIIALMDADEAEGPETINLSINPSGLYAVAGSPATIALADGPSNQRGEIQGKVFEDSNGDGIQNNDENPLSGWQIGLDLNNDGSVGANEPVALTDEQGNYQHVALIAGTYHLLVLTPSGWVGTAPGDRTTTIAAGAVASAQDFSAALPVTVTGFVFDDEDINGQRSGAEPPRPNVLVWADLNGNGAIDPLEPSILTAASGEYALTDIPPGQHFIRADTGSSWTGTNGADGGARVVSASEGQLVQGIDHGQRPVAPSIGNLAVSRASVQSGATVTLSAQVVDPWASRVDFFRESNGTPGLQVGTGGDTEIGSDALAGDGWSLRTRLRLAAGLYHFYAVADDDANLLGSAAESEVISVTGTNPLPAVGIRSLTPATREGGSFAAVFEIYRTGDNTDALTVSLAPYVAAGFASPGDDFQTPPASVQIPAGQDVVRLYLPIVDDNTAESQETLRLDLLTSTNYTLLGSAQAGVSVLDSSTTPASVQVISSTVTVIDGLSAVQLALTADVSASMSAGDVTLLNLSTGQYVLESSISIEVDPLTGAWRLAVPSAGGGTGILPPGRYRLTLSGSGLTDTLGHQLDGNSDGVPGDDYTLEFDATAYSRAWDGGGDNLTWSDPQNWNGDVVPGSSDDVFLPADQTVHFGAADAPAIVRSLNNAGELRLDSGTFTVTGSVNNAGLISLGHSAHLSVVATYTAVPASRLQVEIATASSYGRLSVTGAATLSGSLELVGVDGYLPSRGDSIEFLNASSITGTFTAAAFPAVAPGLKAPLIYQNNSVKLLITVVADINNSGSATVQDIFDFLALYFAQDARADINGSGSLSVQDIFDFLAAYFANLG